MMGKMTAAVWYGRDADGRRAEWALCERCVVSARETAAWWGDGDQWAGDPLPDGIRCERCGSLTGGAIRGRIAARRRAAEAVREAAAEAIAAAEAAEAWDAERARIVDTAYRAACAAADRERAERAAMLAGGVR